MKPRLLDLFCGAGGATRGYQLAGFEVTGVDIKPQPHYIGEHFVQADALEYVAAHGREFDVIHASPPCQAFTPLAALYPEKVYPDLVAATRAALIATSRPFAIENVVQAPLTHGVFLCGGMFGLRVYRHRRFESSHFMFQPDHPAHVKRTGSNHGQTQRKAAFLAGGFVTVTGNVGTYCGPEGMGIDWMIGDELSQAIPPAYTEWIGRQLLLPVNG